jgi:predicted neuraminidase
MFFDRNAARISGLRRLICFAVALLATDVHPATSAGTSPIVQAEFIYERGPYPVCHASTLVETTSGSLLAAWFGGSAEGRPDVDIYLSHFDAKSRHWTESVRVVDGVQSDGTRFPCWNPVLFQPRDGPLMLFYKVGPSPAAWWGMLTTSTNDGRTWAPPRRLPDGVLGPIKNKPIQLADGTIVGGSSTEDPNFGWHVQIERTHDLGATWEVVGPLATAAQLNAIQPAIFARPGGALQILCRTRERVLATSRSDDGGRTWSALAATRLVSANSGVDALTLVDGRQLLVFNDRAGAKPLSATASWESERCPLSVAISRDGDRWKTIFALETEVKRFGYAYPAVIQTRDGLIHISYTWNRERIKHVVLDPAQLPSPR